MNTAHQVADYLPGELSSVSKAPSRALTSSGHLVFAANDLARGYGLARYNPMLDAVEELLYVVPGAGDGGASDFPAAGKHAFFPAFKPESGRELWSLDTASAERLANESSLRVRRVHGDVVELSCSPGWCNDTRTAYGPYEGDLTNMYSHTPGACWITTHSSTLVTVYALACFLVNTIDTAEGFVGSLGMRSDG